MQVFNANSVDLDQMPHSVASDLGQHCLPMHIVHKNQAVFFFACFFSVTETGETVRIYKENSKMD